MPKSRIHAGKFFLGLVFFLFFGCSSQPRLADPHLLSDLRGYVRPNKSTYELNETIEVNYCLTNVSDKPFQQEIVDASKDAQKPFQAYSFNAFAEKDKNVHLQLKEAQAPKEGPLELAVQEEKVFCKNTFQSLQSGVYHLSFVLQWTRDKKVDFKPVTIVVKETGTGTATKEVHDPTLVQAIEELASSDYKVKLAAKEKLVSQGAKAAPLLIALFDSEKETLRSDAMFTVIVIGQDAIPALLQGAVHKQREIRMRSIYAIGQIGDARALIVLKNALLEDTEPQVRLTALRAVSETLADPLAIPLLIKALEDLALQIREEAIQSLKKRTSQDFNFSASGTLIERQKAIEEWKNWLKNAKE